MKAIIILALLAAASALPRTGQFNRPGFGTKLVGGEDAGEKEFPFHVSLLMSYDSVGDNYPFCGAVIYDENRIITSATCTFLAVNYGMEYVHVVAGSNSLEATEEGQIRRIIASLTHSHWAGPGTFEYDIGILTLDSPLVYTDRVQPIRLALSSSVVNGDVVTIGHGSTRSDAEGSSVLLQKATLKAITNEECNHDFEGVDWAHAITNTMVCGSATKKSVCAGDLGGALVAKDEAGRKYLAGVASFGGDPCGDYPSVFTNIASVRSWLDSKLNQ